MNKTNKGMSPFYPGQPVPVEFFTGRRKEIMRIARSMKQVEQGKPQAVFLTGDYGIGKSSLASFMKYYAEKENSIWGVHVFLGDAQTTEEVAAKTVQSVINIGIYEPTKGEEIRNFLSKYIVEKDLFGFKINLKELKADSPEISKGFLPFLKELFISVNKRGIKGILLIFDEINGITRNPQFAHFIKTIVDENAVSPKPLPIMLILCGVEERRKEMIQNHLPVERIFDVVFIEKMNKGEMEEFFTKSFESIGMKIKPTALESICLYSDGFPKIMHIIGDEIFWIDDDGIVDIKDALSGIMNAAEEIGEKYVDQQVINALQSKDYRSILEKLSVRDFDVLFQKQDIQSNLSDNEKKKFNNFLQRMKKLNVVQSGENRGEYYFTNSMVRLYLMMKFRKY